MSIHKHNSVPDEHEKQEVKNPLDRFIKRIALPTSGIGVLLIILFVVFVPKEDVKDMESIETGYETGGSPELTDFNGDVKTASQVANPTEVESTKEQGSTPVASQDESQNTPMTKSPKLSLNALQPSYTKLKDSIVALNDSASQSSDQNHQEVVAAWEQFDEVYQNLKTLPASTN